MALVGLELCVEQAGFKLTEQNLPPHPASASVSHTLKHWTALWLCDLNPPYLAAQTWFRQQAGRHSFCL